MKSAAEDYKKFKRIHMQILENILLIASHHVVIDENC